MKPKKQKIKIHGRVNFTKQGNAKIKAVVFDWGDVIIKDGELVLEKKYKLHSKHKAAQLRYKNYLDHVERGHGTIKKLDQIMKEVLGFPGSTDEIDRIILEAPLIQPMWKLLSRLKKKYKVAILSNNKRHYPEISAKSAGLSLKGIPVYNSANIGIRKPHPGIYKYLLHKLKLKPGEIIFIDDKIKNINAAKALGIRGIQFTGNIRKLLLALKKLGVEAKI